MTRFFSALQSDTRRADKVIEGAMQSVIGVVLDNDVFRTTTQTAGAHILKNAIMTAGGTVLVPTELFTTLVFTLGAKYIPQAAQKIAIDLMCLLFWSALGLAGAAVIYTGEKVFEGVRYGTFKIVEAATRQSDTKQLQITDKGDYVDISEVEVKKFTSKDVGEGWTLLDEEDGKEKSAAAAPPSPTF